MASAKAAESEMLQGLAPRPHVMQTYGAPAIDAVRGEGSWLWDSAGRSYLDFTSGIAVTSLGHCHPALIEALTAQANTLWHCSNLFAIPAQEELAQRLCAGSFADKVFFSNSGAEALECALKIARRYQSTRGAPQRYRTITFTGSFHGRTLATIAAAGQDKLVNGFGPMMDGFDIVPMGDIEAVSTAIGDHSAAILVEPIQGEGGIQSVEPSFLKYLRGVCDAHGLALIFDEVQCGIGRTGTLYAHQHGSVVPDIMALAKGMGGGFPVGACLASNAFAAGMTPGSHGSTYGGNPMAMAVGNAVLKIVDSPDFLEQVAGKGAHLHAVLTQLMHAFPDAIEAVRGRALMAGLKMKILNVDLVAAARAAGLLLVPAGDNVVRLLPALTVTRDEIDQAGAKLGDALRSLSAHAATA